MREPIDFDVDDKAYAATLRQIIDAESGRHDGEAYCGAATGSFDLPQAMRCLSHSSPRLRGGSCTWKKGRYFRDRRTVKTLVAGQHTYPAGHCVEYTGTHVKPE